jgi:hypothetical protein
MPGVVPGIHVFAPSRQVVDGRDKPGNDEQGNAVLFDFDIQSDVEGGGGVGYPAR